MNGEGLGKFPGSRIEVVDLFAILLRDCCLTKKSVMLREYLIGVVRVNERL